MTNAQALEKMILDYEKEFGKTTVSLQLRYCLCGFKGYEHYKPTRKEFSNFFKIGIDKQPNVWYNKYTN